MSVKYVMYIYIYIYIYIYSYKHCVPVKAAPLIIPL